MIRQVKLSDSKDIINIYNYYILNSNITFEVDALSDIEMQRRIEEITYNYPWIVYEENGKVIGYAYLSKWKERTAYRFTAESSIYVHKEHLGCGIGDELYKDLLLLSREYNIKTIIAGITIPNEKSIKLHEKLGFIKIGEFKDVGYKNEQWLNVGYWQKNI